jgi:hypothetical protein
MQKSYLLKVLQKLGKGRIKEYVRRGDSCVVYWIHCQNLCKCHNVPRLSTTIKRGKNDGDDPN